MSGLGGTYQESREEIVRRIREGGYDQRASVEEAPYFSPEHQDLTFARNLLAAKNSTEQEAVLNDFVLREIRNLREDNRSLGNQLNSLRNEFVRFATLAENIKTLILRDEEDQEAASIDEL